MRSIFISLLSFLFFISANANSSEKLIKADVPPVIDGVLNDAVWEHAKSFDAFKTFIPDFGKEMPEKTLAYISYDEENLYFAFKCFDSEPDKIVGNVCKRDQIRSHDWICVNLDSQNDKQAIYGFYVNAYGVQMDSRYAAGKDDISADFVWYSAGKINEEGYQIEVQIPLKSIRFSNSDPVVMGVILERKIGRLSTQGMFPEMDPSQGYAFQNQMMEISLEGVKHYKLFEAIPAATYSYKDQRTSGEWGNAIHKPDASLTLKYGITSNLVLDATLNPDFSQVESDAGQIDVNLRYNVYYPEKRPFFLEGNEKFLIAATRTYDFDPMYLMVNTRTIVNPLTGCKFSGKINSTNDFTLLYALDEIPGETGDTPSSFVHVPIFRYKKSFNGDSFVGLLYSGNESQQSGNRVYGGDGQIRLNKSTLLEFNAFNSHSSDTSGNISGHAASLFLHGDSRNLEYSVIMKDLDDDFNMNTGFIRRVGVTTVGGLFKPKLYPDSKIFRKIDLELFSTFTRDKIYDMWEYLNFAAVTSQLGGTSYLKVKYYLANEIFLGKRFNTSGLHALFSTQVGNWFYGSVLARTNQAIYYSADPYQGRLNRLSLALGFEPGTNFSSELSVLYTDFHKASDKELVYKYPIERIKLTYQFTKKFFVRGILEYNGFRKSLLTDLLLSYTYVPGTVFYIGYGSLYDSFDLMSEHAFRPDIPYNMNRGLFMKFSYLFRK